MLDLERMAISPATLGARLKRSRLARSLTQEQAANTLGLARTTLVAIEKGERTPSAVELKGLAELYRVQFADLVGRRSVDEPFLPQFRAAISDTVLADPAFAATETLQHYASNYVALEELISEPWDRHYPPLIPLTGIPASAEQFGEELAAAERSRLGLGEAPIPNLRTILEDVVGLRIFTFPMAGNVSGLFAYNDRLGGCVAVNANHPRERRRWTLAHEYAHFLTTRFDPDLFLLGSRWGKATPERVADAFAAHFLMPRNATNRRFTEMTTGRGGTPVVADLLELAQYFGVSVQAMTLRLEDLHRIPSGAWIRLKTRGLKPEIGKRNLGLQPSGMDIQRFPPRYGILAKRAFEAGKISESALARYFDTDRIGVREELAKIAQLEADAEIPAGGLNQPVSA